MYVCMYVCVLCMYMAVVMNTECRANVAFQGHMAACMCVYVYICICRHMYMQMYGCICIYMANTMNTGCQANMAFHGWRASCKCVYACLVHVCFLGLCTSIQSIRNMLGQRTCIYMYQIHRLTLALTCMQISPCIAAHNVKIHVRTREGKKK